MICFIPQNKGFEEIEEKKAICQVIISLLRSFITYGWLYHDRLLQS